MSVSKKLSICMLLPALCLALLSGCLAADPQAEQTEDKYIKAPVSESLKIRDLNSLYRYMPTEQVLYLTVGRGFSEESGEHTWQEINAHDLAWYKSNDTDIYECNALVQFGNEEGPASGNFGYGNMANNATVRLYGINSSARQQKSYRIRINQGNGNVSGMKAFFLSKSFTDPFRFTGKLCSDLITQIDGLMSERTGFVHLYVRDESTGPDAMFVDYGLYTLIEPVNKRYLSNRSLDDSGELYKAVDFDFGRHKGVIMQPTEESFDNVAFEELLEAKGSNDYTKLINMLDALNDPSIPVEDVIGRYFDKESLYDFLAFNILVDNKDTDTTNFYLYSPTGTEKFYIIPWDMDGALRHDYELLRDPSYSEGWEKGIYLYTDSLLFSRIMKSPVCINELSERIAILHEGVLSGENVVRMARELAMKVKPYLYALPDMTFARVSRPAHDQLVEQLKPQMDYNYYAYYDSLETPWPFHIKDPENSNGHVRFTWEESFMPAKGEGMTDDDITYTVELSDTWDFDHMIKTASGLRTTSYDAGVMSPGQYFVRISAVSKDGISQGAYEFYNTELKTTVNGVLCFYVFEDGTIVPSTFE